MTFNKKEVTLMQTALNVLLIEAELLTLRSPTREQSFIKFRNEVNNLLAKIIIEGKN